MDFELFGYLERWNVYFWMQSANGCRWNGTVVFAAPRRRYHKHLNLLHDYGQWCCLLQILGLLVVLTFLQVFFLQNGLPGAFHYSEEASLTSSLTSSFTTGHLFRSCFKHFWYLQPAFLMQATLSCFCYSFFANYTPVDTSISSFRKEKYSALKE